MHWFFFKSQAAFLPHVAPTRGFEIRSGFAHRKHSSPPSPSTATLFPSPAKLFCFIVGAVHRSSPHTFRRSDSMLRPRVCVVAALLLLASLACAQDASIEQSDVAQNAGDVGEADLGNSTAAGNSTVLPLASPAPLDTANSSSTSIGGDAADNSSMMEAPTPGRVDQPLPFFKGVRSCLPFNVLIAAPQQPTEDGNINVVQTTNGRITIVADPSVINATAVAVEDDILTLSLVGEGFFSTQPVVFIVSCFVAGRAASTWLAVARQRFAAAAVPLLVSCCSTALMTHHAQYPAHQHTHSAPRLHGVVCLSVRGGMLAAAPHLPPAAAAPPVPAPLPGDRPSHRW